MTGLYVREIISRRLLRRVLIVPPPVQNAARHYMTSNVIFAAMLAESPNRVVQAVTASRDKLANHCLDVFGAPSYDNCYSTPNLV